MSSHLQLHGTAVAIEGQGVLLRGPAGAGKSDLAWRLIEAGAVLIADDLVEIYGMDKGSPSICQRLWITAFAAPSSAGARGLSRSPTPGLRRFPSSSIL